MDNCQHCGAPAPSVAEGARYCPNCGEPLPAAQASPAQQHTAVVPLPTQVFAAVPDGVQTGSAGAVPTAAEDPYEAYFRPAPGERSPHTMTQVIPAVAPPQPAYDQPIDYQAGPGQQYPEPYEGSYADGYDDRGGAEPPRSGRGAMIGVGVAATAVVVIVVSLITMGGDKSAAQTQPQPGNSTQVVQPTQAPSSAAAPPPATSAPTTAAPTTPTPTVSHPPGTLGLGDSGPEVKWLQGRLKQLHFYDGQITGQFDQATAAAVQAFQAQAHTADPATIVGRSTKTALIAWGSRPKLVFQPFGDGGGDKKHPGQNPADVKRLQQALASALGTAVPVNGVYDMQTVGFVMSYETKVGLMPDGQVGDRVWAALQSGKLGQ